MSGHSRKSACAWRIHKNHAAIGVWYSPRQCFCQRYEAKLISDPGPPASGRRPSIPACVRCSLKYFWNSRSFASRSAVVQNNVDPGTLKVRYAEEHAKMRADVNAILDRLKEKA